MCVYNITLRHPLSNVPLYIVYDRRRWWIFFEFVCWTSVWCR